MYLQERVDKKTRVRDNTVNDINYDSILEAQEGSNLDDLLKEKKILGIKRQFKLDFFIVIENKVPILKCNPTDNERRYGLWLERYYMDFAVDHKDGTIELIEVKGLRAKDWKRKWNMTEAVFGNDPGYILKIKT